MARAAPLVPPTGCWVIPSLVAAPTVPEALKVTGLPASPAAVAVTVLLSVPAAVPRVQVVSVAMPEALVTTTAGVAGAILPPVPSAVRVKVTLTPLTGLLLASVTSTDGATAAVPTVAL